MSNSTSTVPQKPKGEQYFVYLVQLGDESIYKIGVSQNPQKRLAGLQTSSPLPLRFVATVDAQNQRMASKVERRLHGLFDSKRTQGEWFSLSSEDVLYVRAVFDTIRDARKHMRPQELLFELRELRGQLSEVRQALRCWDWLYNHLAESRRVAPAVWPRGKSSVDKAAHIGEMFWSLLFAHMRALRENEQISLYAWTRFKRINDKAVTERVGSLRNSIRQSVDVTDYEGE